jgi:hypothetical protein
LYDDAVNGAVADFRKSPGAGAKRFIGSRILVIKSATPQERGVIVVDYQYVFPLMAGLFNLSAICERYDLVLEPSWADVLAPEILLFTKQTRPVFVQTIEPRDHAALNALSSNLRIVPIAANWWVDPRHTPPPAGPRDIDVIMVAAWADIKRHWRVFRALADLRKRGRRLKTVLVGYRYDRTRRTSKASPRTLASGIRSRPTSAFPRRKCPRFSRARRFTSCGHDASAPIAPSSRR